MSDQLKRTGPETDVNVTLIRQQPVTAATAPIKMPTRLSCEAEFEQWLEALLQSERQKLRKCAAIKKPRPTGSGGVRTTGGQTLEDRSQRV